ncbi:MAG: SUMF1/EgtB/PvdO family nonheme iron enzyme [Alphaproteobacteria bacterium]|nr:SUMF1/EgtB/PvdO family nonheme iron enzyme [Alphaproteobacteria bacterium]
MTDQTAGEERVIRLASIVSIDIVGFSTMSERDQRNAARKVENLRARIERVAIANGGRLFNTAGDGFMLEFASAGQALGAIQELLDKRGKGEPPIRVGAHVGDVIVTATDDLLGHGVNVAARLQELAEAGSALVSSEFRSMARNSPQSAFQSKGQKPLDNIDQRVQTFEILSKRQKFARSSRRVGSMALAAAVLGVLAYFSPQLFSMGMEYWRNRPQPAAEQQQAEVQQAAATTVQTPASPTEDSPTRVPGYTFSDCSGCPEMTVLAGGLFVMGSPDNEPGRGRDEGPQREVSVTPFAMGKYEVTFAQWDACLAGGGCNGYSPPDGGWGRGDRPVTGVSWEDAQAYVNWLNSQAGGTSYRLPSEAEWEYAARAGQAAAYAFGARVTQTEATFHARQTTPVGAHAPNAFNLYDMHGNAGELVEDCYAANYDLAPIDGVAVEADECRRRVYRGGSYNDQAPVLRAAARRFTETTSRTQGIGFRVARTLN